MIIFPGFPTTVTPSGIFLVTTVPAPTITRFPILIWGKTLFSERPPNTLKALAVSLQDTAIQQQFEQLDRQLYQGIMGDSEALDIDQLLRHLRKQSTFSRGTNQAKSAGHGLKDLYPT